MEAASVDTDRLEVVRAARASVTAALFLTGMKLIVGITSGSLGVLSEALHSGLDLIAAGVTLVAVRAASKGPDEDHTYGHGKVESFAALAETIMLWVTSAWIIYEAFRRILYAEWPESTLWGVVVMAISIGVDYSRSRMLYHTAEKHGSQALEADALHFSTDMIGSAVVILGLLFVWLGFPIGDPVAALGVSVVIIYVSLNLGRRAFDELVDTAPPGLRGEIIRLCESTPGVARCERVRVRGTVQTTFIDIEIAVDDSVDVASAHEIANAIEDGIQEMVPGADVVVHVKPVGQHRLKYDGSDVYSIMQAIARSHPMIKSLHNVRVNSTHEGVYVAAHLEMDGQMTIAEAHRVSEEFEKRLREAAPRVTRVVLHLESAETSSEGKIVTDGSEGVVASVKHVVESVPAIEECRDIVIGKTREGINVSVTCALQGSMSLEDGHRVSDKIEREIRRQHPEIVDVVVHIEPA